MKELILITIAALYFLLLSWLVLYLLCRITSNYIVLPRKIKKEIRAAKPGVFHLQKETTEQVRQIIKEAEEENGKQKKIKHRPSTKTIQ